MTPKQEKFARLVAEGNSYSGAYREAYDAKNSSNEVIWKEASILMSDRKVSVRVLELQEMAQERTLSDIERLTREYEEARQLALESGQASAAVAATTGKGKLHGLFEKDNQQQVTIPPMQIEFVAPDLPLPEADEDNC